MQIDLGYATVAQSEAPEAFVIEEPKRNDKVNVMQIHQHNWRRMSVQNFLLRGQRDRGHRERRPL